MEKSAETSFEEILHQLEQAGALRRLILVGSWCLLVYKHIYNDAPEIPALRTTDLDFLIREPKVNIPRIDVPSILENLGFTALNDIGSGLTKYERDDLEIEFLIAQMRGGDSVVKVPHLTVSAQMLRYMEIANGYSKPVNYKGITLSVPEISAFVLHKILIQPLRNNEAKKEKDAATINSLCELLAGQENLRTRTVEIFEKFPKTWRNKILSESKEKYPDMVRILGV
ncbi:MAG: nucleotidyltransferase domain-containing protein [Fibrobacter sp.]|nr:nucleotidyltransferase domain-containing protein [Fibrobacter sp.]